MARIAVLAMTLIIAVATGFVMAKLMGLAFVLKALGIATFVFILTGVFPSLIMWPFTKGSWKV